ncbi:TauD/TfdA family dioxygenase [Blastomonas marina]|uniref:TauD/TfdA dioxygenase family protein n=1 Tax=Blastomonas marina TaxID=1867408 RepID=UPI002AC9BDEA|nr:TauD/TfdA family dioxygenase [Blastomonas marina]WPZ04194.1 TauD/TfdA family dioxygenase [Blastomonas marina]
MRIAQLNNGVEVSDIDLSDDEACRELGRLVAHECVVLLRQKVSERRLYEIQMLWGQPCMPIINRYVMERRLAGKHWREAFLAMGAVSSGLKESGELRGMARVSFEKNERGRPTGLFPNGELDWHADQQAYHDNQRIVGLMSLWGSESSRTSFLCTAPVYDALNHEDRSMVDELRCVWAWDGGDMCPDIDGWHLEIIRYNMIPFDGMETALVDRTVTGRVGMRFPSHCFSHFKGMTKAESERYKAHLWSLVNREEYIFDHDWHDGEIVFMDQNITLHARPTNIVDSHTRTMTRMISYLDRLYPGNGPADHVLYDGTKLGHEEFAAMVDAQRRKEYEELVPVA